MNYQTKNVAAKPVEKQGAETGEDGRLALLISTDAMDSEGDVVEQSWEFASQIPFLWVHDGKRLPLGHVVNPRVVDVRTLDVDVSEDAQRGTVVDVDFDDQDEFAQAVKRKYQRGDIEDSSVGFDPLDFEEFGDDEPGRFHFLRSRLKEVSSTPIGANDDTQPISKMFDPDVIPEQLKEGRRNNKIDEQVKRHAKEMIEFTLGDIDAEQVGQCPLHKSTDEEMADETEIDKGEGAYVIEQEMGEIRIKVAADSAEEAQKLWDKYARGETSEPEHEKDVTPYQDLALADRDEEWSGADAVDSMREADGLEEGEPVSEADEIDALRRGHMWHADEIETMDDLKLPYAEAEGDSLTAVPRAITTIAGVLQGAQGGVDVPESDKDGLRSHVGRYYAKMREQFEDFDELLPWEEEQEPTNEPDEKSDDPLPWSEDEFFEDGDSGSPERKGQTVPDELTQIVQ